MNRIDLPPDHNHTTWVFPRKSRRCGKKPGEKVSDRTLNVFIIVVGSLWLLGIVGGIIGLF